jgi:hypothetical protein
MDRKCSKNWARNVYSVLTGNPQREGALGIQRCRWIVNIEMDLREIRWDGVDWIDLVQDIGR